MDNDSFSSVDSSDQRSYVLKRNGGERLMGDIIVVEATPLTGTEGGEMLTATLLGVFDGCKRTRASRRIPT